MIFKLFILSIYKLSILVLSLKSIDVLSEFVELPYLLNIEFDFKVIVNFSVPLNSVSPRFNSYSDCVFFIKVILSKFNSFLISSGNVGSISINSNVKSSLVISNFNS